MSEKEQCGRRSEGFIIWPGRSPMPMCPFHKEGPLKLSSIMGFGSTYVTADAGPCESRDPHPDDEEEPNERKSEHDSSG